MPLSPNHIIFSGLFTFRLVGFLWALEISTHHSGRYESLTTASCKVPFGVSPAVSFATEAFGSLALGLGIPLIAENPTLANNSPLAASLAISGLVVAVVVCALPLSGGIFNPMLGSVLFGGCEGHTMVNCSLAFPDAGILIYGRELDMSSTCTGLR